MGLVAVVIERLACLPVAQKVRFRFYLESNVAPRAAELITSLAKEVIFLVALVCLSVCLFVCLFVDNITQNVMNRLRLNFMEESWIVQ